MIPEDSRLHVDDGDHSEDNCMRAYARRTTSSSIIVICIHIYILNAGMYFVCGAWYGHIVRDLPQWGGFCPEPRPLEWSGLPCAPMYGGGACFEPRPQEWSGLVPQRAGGTALRPRWAGGRATADLLPSLPPSCPCPDAPAVEDTPKLILYRTKLCRPEKKIGYEEVQS